MVACLYFPLDQTQQGCTRSPGRTGILHAKCSILSSPAALPLVLVDVGLHLSFAFPCAIALFIAWSEQRCSRRPTPSLPFSSRYRADTRVCCGVTVDAIGPTEVCVVLSAHLCGQRVQKKRYPSLADECGMLPAQNMCTHISTALISLHILAGPGYHQSPVAKGTLPGTKAVTTAPLPTSASAASSAKRGITSYAQAAASTPAPGNSQFKHA